MTFAAGKRGPQWHTIAAPAPDRLVGILYRRPKTTTCHHANTSSSHRRQTQQPMLYKPSPWDV
jgi:hypothetical protein